MKLVHWPLMGAVLHLVQRGVDWAGPQTTQPPPRWTLKMREWKMQEQTARVENPGVENVGATKYGKPSEENTLKYQTKYGCRGFHS